MTAPALAWALLALPPLAVLAVAGFNVLAWPRGSAAGRIRGRVSVCIPARDEAARIERCVRAALAGTQAPDEVLVYDDGSTDGTGEIVARVAAEDPRVDALVTWAAVSDIPARWSAEQTAAWERGETVEIANQRTGQRMPVAPSYWRDVQMNRERLDILRAAGSLTIPWLIVHGEDDETVPAEEGRALFEAGGEETELLLVEGTGHTFGAAHPYAGATPELRAAVEATVEWFGEHLV